MRYYETQTEWVETKTYGRWKCIYCGRDPKKKYIATGHDHTDYDYNICCCLGAARNGKPHEDLI